MLVFPVRARFIPIKGKIAKSREANVMTIIISLAPKIKLVIIEKPTKAIHNMYKRIVILFRFDTPVVLNIFISHQ
jgi:hypothetical protein